MYVSNQRIKKNHDIRILRSTQLTTHITLKFNTYANNYSDNTTLEACAMTVLNNENAVNESEFKRKIVT